MPACRLPASAVVFLACLVVPPFASAADSEWQISPYGWIASFEGTVGGAGGDADTGGEAEFDHAWENTGLAGAMVNANWRRDRWTAFGDWTYAKVSSDSPTRVPALYDSIEGEVKGHVLQGYAGYDLMPRDTSHLDLFAGARYYNLDLTVDLTGAAAQSRQLQGGQAWFDAVAGLRWTRQYANHWRTYLSGDVGVGGSDSSWQGYAGVGYDFSWGALIGGWRYLHIDYDSGSYQLDAALTGPFVGASWTF
ncbi:MAG: hypothetical protein JNK40_03545 [Chromatiales bacterium]|nr:hypothetical protein [Chromatiales bacterium]